jgi:hypothetical protein
MRNCGKSEQDLASYYYLLVVKLVVKWGWFTTKDLIHQRITFSASLLGISKCFSFSLFFNI